MCYILEHIINNNYFNLNFETFSQIEIKNNLLDKKDKTYENIHL